MIQLYSSWYVMERKFFMCFGEQLLWQLIQHLGLHIPKTFLSLEAQYSFPSLLLMLSFWTTTLMIVAVYLEYYIVMSMINDYLVYFSASDGASILFIIHYLLSQVTLDAPALLGGFHYLFLDYLCHQCLLLYCKDERLDFYLHFSLLSVIILNAASLFVSLM